MASLVTKRFVRSTSQRSDLASIATCFGGKRLSDVYQLQNEPHSISPRCVQSNVMHGPLWRRLLLSGGACGMCVHRGGGRELTQPSIIAISLKKNPF